MKGYQKIVCLEQIEEFISMKKITQSKARHDKTQIIRNQRAPKCLHCVLWWLVQDQPIGNTEPKAFEGAGTQWAGVSAMLSHKGRHPVSIWWVLVRLKYMFLMLARPHPWNALRNFTVLIGNSHSVEQIRMWMFMVEGWGESNMSSHVRVVLFPAPARISIEGWEYV